MLAVDPEVIVDRVKQLEIQTEHDVKALEMAIVERLTDQGLAHAGAWVHFACTSWDINNLAYARMLRQAQLEVICPALEKLRARLDQLAGKYADAAMLGHTHGQPATPTTFGKEMRVFERRLWRQLTHLKEHIFDGKFNGAVGNYNAHCVAGPHIDWQVLAQQFVAQMDLRFTDVTTQIEPYDGMVEFFDILARINCILLDLAQDASNYAALGYLRSHQAKATVGSSTMPHKINPIRFENAEGNLIFANTMLRMFAQQLPVSRLQRDLSDSTLLRNIGVAVGHGYLAWNSLCGGLESISIDRKTMLANLNDNWQILAEAAQTILRVHGHADAYEKLKHATRGHGKMDQTQYQNSITAYIPAGELRDKLMELRPENYLGLAVKLANFCCDDETTSRAKTERR